LIKRARTFYQLRYNQVVQAWASYIAQAKPGAKPNITVKEDPNRPGKLIQIAVTPLPRVDNGTNPEQHPGVLFIHIFGSNVKPKLATAIMKVGSDEGIVVNPAVVDQSDIHIFGLSEPTRQALSGGSPTIGSLAMPVVFRGESVDGGDVAIHKDEAGNIHDLSKDPKGSEWLAWSRSGFQP
jgi:hypothetical protein